MTEPKSDDPITAFEGLAGESRALVVAVDDVLIRCNLTVETLIFYTKVSPLGLLDVITWVAQGRAKLQRKLAERVSLDVDSLPVNEQLVAALARAAAAGRPVYLASSSDALLVEQLAKRFAFVRGVVASDQGVHLKGAAMAQALTTRFPDGFDYAGCRRGDLEIWRRAKSAILVDVSPGLERRVAALAPIVARSAAPSRWRGLIRSFRLHQWIKNALVFAPLVLGGQLSHAPSLWAVVVAFFALGLVASATYLVNDMLDAADDRRHWSKKDRPIASGLLPMRSAGAFAAAGLTGGLGLAALISWPAVAVLLIYLATTLAYSLGVKRVPLLDGLVLAGLFTLRLALGVVAAQVPPSPWLFVFSMFLFSSLSYAKRWAELSRSVLAAGTTRGGRGYRPEDLPLLLSVGIAAGIGSVVILILYIIDDAFQRSFYGSVAWLWGLPLLTFLLICRIWLTTVRGHMSDDPVEFVLKDRASLAVASLLAVCFYMAWIGG